MTTMARSMTTISLFIGYSAAVFAASLLGGWLPSILRMTHTRMQVVMSFVAGLMLGVACYHLLPHAIHTLPAAGAVDRAVWWLMIGLLFMFVLLRSFHFHHHDLAEEDDGHDHHHEPAHEHSHAHNHGGHSDQAQSAHPLSWTGIALGLSLHTLIDGIALGAAIQADALHPEGAGLLSIGVFAAILLHKPLDAMSITSLMVASGWSSRARWLVNAGFGLMCPLGAALFLWGMGQWGGDQSVLVGCALAFSAGVFLCISLSDLLPEVQFHSHDRTKLTLALLLGILVAYGIGSLEPDYAHSDTVRSDSTHNSHAHHHDAEH